MHRHIVFPGQIPLDTDILNSIQDGYYGLGWLAESLIGTGTAVVGLVPSATIPASLQVIVAPGAIYSLQTVDSAAYGSLGTDANQFVKQGLSPTTQTLTITPPATVGYSTNYLIQVAFSEVDSEAIILPYYNAADPSVAWSGPNNSGASQNTVRQDICVVGLKAGVPAATGSQTTPSPDAGYTGIYVVTVANGQTTITSANISVLATAPYFPTLPQVPTFVQNNSWVYAVAGGSANALTAAISPIPSGYTAGLDVILKITATNTGASTLNLNSLGAVAITRADLSPVQAGDLRTGSIMVLTYDGIQFQVSGLISSNLPSTTTQSFTSTTTWTPPAGVTKIKRARVWGGGGGGGGANANAGAAGAGGGGGGYAEGINYTVTPGVGITITVGTGGSGGATTPTSGGAGGSSSFGSLISATGGAGGGGGNSGIQPSGSAGGVGSSGNVLNLSGQAGGTGYGVTGGVLSGIGGGTFAATSAGPNAGTAGSLGASPGGGGAGASGTSGSGFTGGAGANGLIIIEY
ncbi:hypothetical protein G6M02_08220 [Agrobacterium rhizogenes]|nr:hypothetical protein [Rhizobium rhizogenes]